MPLRFGATELIIILVIVILVFGVGRIGKIGAEFSGAIRSFREAVKSEDHNNGNEEV